MTAPRLSLPAAAALALLAVAACRPAADQGAPSAVATIADGSTLAGIAGIAADETISFSGTEPFWNGKVGGGRLTYATPENQAGETIAVRRFAGNNGLGFTGTMAGQPLDLTVTPGQCSDGMSDRVFPLTATLRIGTEQRNGCAWTDRRPYSQERAP